MASADWAQDGSGQDMRQRPSQGAQITEPPRNMARQTTQEVQALFDTQMRLTPADLATITGEEGDILPDEQFAVGTAQLTFQNVSFSLPQSRARAGGAAGATPKSDDKSVGSDGRKKILEPISGHYLPGQLVALMGPSGSGKTTLLDILAGKKNAPHQGTIHINGRARDMLWNRIISYVPQDDLMFAHLTVEETLRFHANLKTQRPARITRQMDQLRIEAFLQAFGLHDIRKSYVGNPKQGSRGISGGQRRRLSLAKGVACGARIMFCDEPTSGLSATDAELCVRYMRWLSHKYSVLIIMSIHQPRREVARLFDELILLTSSPGRAVYQGPMRLLPDYAEQVGYPIPLKRNPTDFIMDLITPGMKTAREGEFVTYFDAEMRPRIEDEVEKHLHEDRGPAMQILREMREPMKVFGAMPPLRHSKYGVTFRTQVWIVAWRQFKLRYRDKTHLLLDLAAAVAKALILGLAYYDIGEKGQPLQLGFFFFVLMACSIDQVKTMPAMIAERNVMKLETSEALYSEWAYILPVTVMSALQAIVTHGVFISLLWPFVSFPLALFWHVWFWSLMVNTVMDSLYVMLSGIAKDATIAQIMSLPFLLIFMLYNGFTVSRTTCPKWLLWALDVSPVAYAMEAITMAASQICVYEGPPCGRDGFYPGIIAQFSYKPQRERALIVMCVCILLFRAIHMVCLKCLNNIQR